jgi:hypothetical protein
MSRTMTEIEIQGEQIQVERQLQAEWASIEKEIDEEMEARSVKYSERKETLVAWGVI